MDICFKIQAWIVKYNWKPKGELWEQVLLLQNEARWMPLLYNALVLVKAQIQSVWSISTDV